MLERCVHTSEVLAPQQRVLRVLTGDMFDGRGGRVSPTEAALRAADWFDGYAVYQRPLLRHVLFVTGATLPYFQVARALSAADRAALAAGEISLSFARRCMPRANVIDISA